MRNTFGSCRSHILRAHVDTTHFEAELARRRSLSPRHAGPAPVSAMMRRLAHAPRQQDLTEHIVDLVRARVVQLVALEVDLRAAEIVRSDARRNTSGDGRPT